MEHLIVVKTRYMGEHMFVVAQTEWESFNPHLTETTQYCVNNVVFNLHTLYHTATIIDSCADAVIQFVTQHGDCNPLTYLRNFVSSHRCANKNCLQAAHKVFQIKSLTHFAIPSFLTTTDILAYQRTSQQFRDVKHHTFIMSHPQPTIPPTIRHLHIKDAALTEPISSSLSITGLVVLRIDFSQYLAVFSSDNGKANITAIAHLIQTNPTLTTVQIDEAYIRPGYVRMFSEIITALVNLPRLTHLTYNSNIPIRLGKLENLITSSLTSIESVTGLTTLICPVDTQEEADKLTQILIDNPGLYSIGIASTDELETDVSINWPMMPNVEILGVGNNLEVNLDQFPRVSQLSMGRLYQISETQLVQLTKITIHTQEDYEVVKDRTFDYVMVHVTDNLVLANDCQIRDLGVIVCNDWILDYPSPYIESLSVEAHAATVLPGSQTLKRLTICSNDAAVMVTGSYPRVTHLHIEVSRITICRGFEEIFPSLQSFTYSSAFAAHLNNNKRLKDGLVPLGYLE